MLEPPEELYMDVQGIKCLLRELIDDHQYSIKPPAKLGLVPAVAEGAQEP